MRGAQNASHSSSAYDIDNRHYTLWEHNEKYLQTHICYRLLILSMRSIEDIKHYRVKM